MPRFLTFIAPGERQAIFSLALAALCALAFIRVAALVAGETPGDFDVHIITALRNPNDLSDPIGPGWVEEAMRDLTALGGTAVLVLGSLATFGYLLMTGKTHSAFVLAASVVGAFLLSHAMKFGFSRPRPDLVPHGARIYTLSFPSGHAMMSTAVYLTLAALLARTQKKTRVKVFVIAIAAILAILVGASRVYLGVHWPTDVIAGWAGGAGWAIFCWSIMYWLQQRGQVEAEGEAPGSADISRR
ncbi:MAG: phosphatase PAP2 family protein [Beijerinckiaceae bacterium]|nr:phosphatase PAP2 family protein [Beijerinckiaceae bacterium]